MKWDLPGGPVVENLPSDAGDACLILGWGIKNSHAMGLQSPHTSMKDPACHN